MSTPPMHIHLGQDEFFKVITGTLEAIVNGKRVTLTKEDDEFLAVKGQPHTFWSNEAEGDMMFGFGWSRWR